MPYVKVAELITWLGDAKREECLCLVLRRHSAALWLHEHILYFGMTSASFSTQGWLIGEGIGLWRRKLLWVNCPECHRCHWSCCHGRSSEQCLIGRQRDAVLEKQMLSSLSGQQQSPLRLSLSLTVCCVFSCRQYLWQC